MAQMCLGLSVGFGPTIRPWFHEMRVPDRAVFMVCLERSMLSPSCPGANRCLAPAAVIGIPPDSRRSGLRPLLPL